MCDNQSFWVTGVHKADGVSLFTASLATGLVSDRKTAGVQQFNVSTKLSSYQS